MAAEDILSILKTLAESGGSIAVEIKGSNVEEAMAQVRKQLPEGLPQEVVDAIEMTVRNRIQARLSGEDGDSGKESPTQRFAGWTEAQADLMLGIIIMLVTDMAAHEPEMRKGNLVSNAISHFLHCSKWDLSKLEPMVAWMLDHPERVPSNLSSIKAMVLDLMMGCEVTARDSFRSSNSVDDFDEMMDACYPGMSHIATVFYHHVDNFYESGLHIEGFLSYAVPIVMLATKQIVNMEESREIFTSERLTEVKNQLLADKELDTQYTELRIREAMVALPALSYLEHRVAGNAERCEYFGDKLPDEVLPVLDAAALLIFGNRATDTVIH